MSWLQDPSMTWQPLSFTAEYIAAFYWATSTLSIVGAGNVMPLSSSERLWAIFAMFVGVIGCARRRRRRHYRGGGRGRNYCGVCGQVWGDPVERVTESFH
jgi:hypothetical protein